MGVSPFTGLFPLPLLSLAASSHAMTQLEMYVSAASNLNRNISKPQIL